MRSYLHRVTKTQPYRSSEYQKQHVVPVTVLLQRPIAGREHQQGTSSSDLAIDSLQHLHDHIRLLDSHHEHTQSVLSTPHSLMSNVMSHRPTHLL